MQSLTNSRFNLVSCLEWVRKGVAKANPEVLKLRNSEIRQLIEEANDVLRGDTFVKSFPQTTIMAYLDDLSQLLTTYRGRDKVLKLLCYAAKLVSYQDVYEGGELSKKLQIFSSKLSASRTVLRLLDDIPTIRNCLRYGYGKHEVNGIVRVVHFSLNLIQLTYGVVEKVSWCTNNNILERTDKSGAPDSTEVDDDDEQNGDGSDPEGDVPDFQMDTYDENPQTSSNITSLITLDASDQEDSDDDSGSEKENQIIKPNDNLVVVAHVTDDLSTLEVYVFNDDESSLYVHHDMLLPNYPLCMEWLSYEPGNPNAANLCALGSMSTVIEIWDLDLVNCLEPAFKLGRKLNKRKNVDRIGHSKEVLDLAWNREFQHILASASADKTVILWDIDKGMPHTVVKNFQKQVNCLKWNPIDYSSLLIGSSDRTLKLFNKSDFSAYKSWSCNSEVEKVYWDPENESSFYATTDNGYVYHLDSRNENEVIFSEKVAGNSVNFLAKTKINDLSLMITSNDNLIRVWDLRNQSNWSLLIEKDMEVGEILEAKLCPDHEFKIAVAGNKTDNNFAIYDLRNLNLFNEINQL